MAKVIAVANQKGGVGKTTTSVNLAACLGDAGKKTLLLDTDPQGNATSGIGVEQKKNAKSIYDCLINDDPLKDVVVKTKYKNLFCCPANQSLSGAEIELVGMMGREYKLKNAVNSVRDKYDFVIIDCPPSLGLITLNALTAADSVLVPIQCEYYALEGLSQLTGTIRQVKKVLNPPLDIEGVLLTMFDARTNLSIQVVEEVKKFFPQKVYKTVVPRNIRLSEAPGFGEPITVYDKTSRGAQSYIELAEEVMEKNGGAV